MGFLETPALMQYIVLHTLRNLHVPSYLVVYIKYHYYQFTNTAVETTVFHQYPDTFNANYVTPVDRNYLGLKVAGLIDYEIFQRY